MMPGATSQVIAWVIARVTSAGSAERAESAYERSFEFSTNLLNCHGRKLPSFGGRKRNVSSPVVGRPETEPHG